jgi:3-hydroxyacyl-[acyl-carrier-protein] dehydratase
LPGTLPATRPEGRKQYKRKHGRGVDARVAAIGWQETQPDRSNLHNATAARVINLPAPASAVIIAPQRVSRNTMSTEKINLDIHKILTLLPHRYPILLVDRVLELEPHKSIKALKNVSINEPYFMGHFPKRPVMPGVLILEALAQTAALLTFAEEPHDPDNTLYLFVGIDNARFKRVVEPGDQLILNVTFERHMRGIWKFKARAEVDGQVAAEADLMCAVRTTEDGQ